MENEKEKEKEFSIYRKNDLLLIKNNKSINTKNESLEINSSYFTLKTSKEKNDLGTKIIDCIGIIGIITLENSTYLITITDAKLICSISKKEIYKIIETNFIKFNEENDEDDFCCEEGGSEDDKNEEKDNENINNDVQDNDEEIIKSLQNLFKTGFYFSNKYDLANSITSYNQILEFYKKDKLLGDYDHIINGNKNYLANIKLIEKILSEEEKDKINIKFYFSNVIYGNIECFSYEKQKIQIILISRRYLWNYGIYEYRKGLSKYGGNSNQIETELIMVYNNNEIFSNIFMTGYLPIYFRQNVDNSKVNKAFIKYFKSLIDEYNILFLFALKKDNGKYIDKFKNMLIKNKNSLSHNIKYFEIKTDENNIYDILNNLKVKKDLIEFVGYNHSIDIKIDKEISQIGIFYLLSMDEKILNENEFYLIYDIIYHFLIYLNKSNNNVPLFLEENKKINFNQENNIEMNNNDEAKEFIDKLKIIIKSRHEELYQQHYINNNNEESAKKNQRILELLFENNFKHKTIQDNLNNLKEDFSVSQNLKVYVATWNVAGLELNQNSNIDLDSWLLPKDSNIIPDIYFVGLQEVVELKASNIIMANQDKIHEILYEWDTIINKTIQKIGKYKKFSEMNLIGINFYCYILEDKFNKISNISTKRIKTGLGGTTGNKGSCCLYFEYETTSISVVCSHLCAGESKNKNKSRQSELRYILNLSLDSFFNSGELSHLMKEEFDLFDLSQSIDNNENNYNNTKRTKSDIFELYKDSGIQHFEENENARIIKNSDIWIIFGDLNFRVETEYEDFSDFIENKNPWNKLIGYDQFTKFKLASLDLFGRIEEDPINFPPTYKYIKNTNEFDYKTKNLDKKKSSEVNGIKTSKRKKNPSWCDRIIYKKNAFITKNGQKIIKGIEYNSIMNDNFKVSDHRPVYQIFDVITFKEDKTKKDLLEKEISQNEVLGISNKYLKKKKFDF